MNLYVATGTKTGNACDKDRSAGQVDIVISRPISRTDAANILSALAASFRDDAGRVVITGSADRRDGHKAAGIIGESKSPGVEAGDRVGIDDRRTGQGVEIRWPDGNAIQSGIDDGVVLKRDVRAGRKAHGGIKGIDDRVRGAVGIGHRAGALTVTTIAHHHGLLLLAVTVAAAA